MKRSDVRCVVEIDHNLPEIKTCGWGCSIPNVFLNVGINDKSPFRGTCQFLVALFERFYGDDSVLDDFRLYTAYLPQSSMLLRPLYLSFPLTRSLRCSERTIMLSWKTCGAESGRLYLCIYGQSPPAELHSRKTLAYVDIIRSLLLNLRAFQSRCGNRSREPRRTGSKVFLIFYQLLFFIAEGFFPPV